MKPPKERYYQADKNWADEFDDEIRQIVAPYFMIKSNEFEDQHENTDYVLIVPSGARVSGRVRFCPDQLALRWDDTTIRKMRYSGNETELSKMMNGKGDAQFYAQTDGRRLLGWWLLHLDPLRVHIRRGDINAIEYGNKDFSSRFLALRLTSTSEPPSFIIDCSFPEEFFKRNAIPHYYLQHWLPKMLIPDWENYLRNWSRRRAA